MDTSTKGLAISTVAFLALGIAATLSAAEQKKDVDIKAPDGMELKGTYFSPGKPGPAILLLHQCNMDRHAWDGLAEDLAGNGFHVLALDFRGYGGSVDEHYKDPTQGRAAMREKWPADVDAAYQFLIAQKGVDKSRVAAGGASCGMTQAADLATRHHEIKALMLLSSVASEDAKAYIAGNPSLPVFGAASEGDTNAAKGIRDVLGVSKDPQSKLKIYPGSEHGVPMFAKNADLQPMIVAWLKAQMGSRGGASR